jgi:uncharacterized protein YndB with AHSA1/START domain
VTRVRGLTLKHEFLYSVEREYAHPIETVWHAWTDAAALEAWYHPTDLANVVGSSKSDPIVGGRWAIAVDVPAYNMVSCFYGLYTKVETHQLLEHTMCYTQDMAEFAAMDDSAPHHNIVVEFEIRGGKTWVKFSQFGELPEGHAPRAQAGMESYFDSLANYLSA